jgi:hypothetical protein
MSSESDYMNELQEMADKFTKVLTVVASSSSSSSSDPLATLDTNPSWLAILKSTQTDTVHHTDAEKSSSVASTPNNSSSGRSASIYEPSANEEILPPDSPQPLSFEDGEPVNNSDVDPYSNLCI